MSSAWRLSLHPARPSSLAPPPGTQQTPGTSASGGAAGKPRPASVPRLGMPAPATRARLTIRATSSDKKPSPGTTTTEEVEEITKKWGLEAGLWKALRSGKSEAGSEQAPEGEASGSGASGASAKSNTEMAKELLTKYGGAYLATSITLSIISFSFFYVLVDRGVDVGSLLDQVGIHVDSTGETVGTVALAYAAHKAASPIRFPPTVVLTPIVANLFSKKD